MVNRVIGRTVWHSHSGLIEASNSPKAAPPGAPCSSSTIQFNSVQSLGPPDSGRRTIGMPVNAGQKVFWLWIPPV